MKAIVTKYHGATERCGADAPIRRKIALHLGLDPKDWTL